MEHRGTKKEGEAPVSSQPQHRAAECESTPRAAVKFLGRCVRTPWFLLERGTVVLPPLAYLAFGTVPFAVVAGSLGSAAFLPLAALFMVLFLLLGFAGWFYRPELTMEELADVRAGRKAPLDTSAGDQLARVSVLGAHPSKLGSHR